MSFTEKKRKEIKKYILRKISEDDRDFIAKTTDAFDISVTSVKRYLQDFLTEVFITENRDTACGYSLVKQISEIAVQISDYLYEEDLLYQKHILPELTECGDKALRIWQYVCAEILNNALEHSKGKEIKIFVETNCLYTTITISDDGVGAFSTLAEAMKTKGCQNPKVEDVMVELLKGKLTSAPAEHSGEGIFFSSKMVDRFVLWSDAQLVKWGVYTDFELVRSHLLAYISRLGKIGTVVRMMLENETERNINDTFDAYADVEQGFFRTEISVLDACLGSQPVARSQARRIHRRLDEFREIVLDFSDVDFMGQGFADELFRVYATAHPEIKIYIKNAVADVLRMVSHVARGNMPENIAFNGQKI